MATYTVCELLLYMSFLSFVNICCILQGTLMGLWALWHNSKQFRLSSSKQFRLCSTSHLHQVLPDCWSSEAENLPPEEQRLGSSYSSTQHRRRTGLQRKNSCCCSLLLLRGWLEETLRRNLHTAPGGLGGRAAVNHCCFPVANLFLQRTGTEYCGKGASLA